MAMALCRRGGALIIKSTPSSSSHPSRGLGRRLVVALTEFTNWFPSVTILSAATLSTHAATTTRSSSSFNGLQSNGLISRPKEDTLRLPGCDFEHWFVVVEKPEGEPTRDEIIDTYIKTLSKFLGSDEEAKKKIYSVTVTTRLYAFGALVSEELAYKIKELPGVRWVLPDAYLDAVNKIYRGEPFKK